MAVFTAPTISATLDTGLSLHVESAQIALDSGQAPYVQATLTCAAPASADLETIDPRNGRRVVVVLNDHADTFGGTAKTRTLNLLVTGRTSDPVTGLVTITAKSDEARLIELGMLAASSHVWIAATVNQLVAAVLGALGYTCTYSAPDYAIDSAAAQQAPGQSYWDFLDGTLQGGNLRLWCDEAGIFHLDDKSTVLPGLLSVAYGVNAIGLPDAIDITADDYYDALVVRYSWTDLSGNPQTSYDYAASTATPRAVGRIDFPTAPAVKGAARRLLRRVKGRGRQLFPELGLRLDATPGQSFVATLPGSAPVQSGLVSSVQWRLPEARMTIGTREASDTLPTAWAAQPAGETWSSIAAGVTWNSFLAIGWSSIPAGTSWDSQPAGLRWQEYGS